MIGILDTVRRRVDATRDLMDLERYAEKVEKVIRRVDSIVNAWTGLGDVGDKGRGGQVNFDDEFLSIEEIRFLCRKNQYARRYVEIFPDYGLRNGWRIADESDDQNPTKEFDKALGVPAITRMASITSRKYGACPVAIVTNHDNPADPWGSYDREILNLVPLDPEEAIPVEWVADMRDPEFRKPKFWNINPRIGSLTTSQTDWTIQGGKWHADRVIYIPGVELSAYERLANLVWYGYDDSVLQTAWDAIRGQTSNDQALNALMEEISVTVIKIEGLAQLNLSDQEETLETRARAIARDKSLNNPILMGDGEEIYTVGANMSGIEHAIGSSRLTLSSAAGVPVTKFFGDNPSGFSTDDASGKDTFNGAIEAYQHHKVAVPWLHPLYERAVETGQVTLQGDWVAEWPPLDVPTEKEQAETRKLHAEGDAIRIQSGVLDPVHVTRSRYGGAEYGEEIDPVPPEELDELDMQAEAEKVLASIEPDPEPPVDPEVDEDEDEDPEEQAAAE